MFGSGFEFARVALLDRDTVINQIGDFQSEIVGHETYGNSCHVSARPTTIGELE